MRRLLKPFLITPIILSLGAVGASPKGPAEAPGPPPPSTQLPLLLPSLESGHITPQDLERLLGMEAGPLLDALKAAPALPACQPPATLTRPLEPDSLDAVHYDVQILDIDEAGQSFQAVTTATILALQPLTALDLNLSGVTVTEVVTARIGDPFVGLAPYMHDALGLHVTLAPPAAQGDTVLVRVAYQATAPTCGNAYGLSSGIVFSSAGVHTFSEPTQGRNWYPCVDVPWDKATCRLQVTVPDGRDASATGTLVLDEIVDGKRVMTWEVTDPVATYLPAFYVGDYVKLDTMSTNGVPLQYYTYPGREAATLADFANVPDMVDFYSQLHPYPFSHYAMTVGYFPGGMEHQTNSLIGEFFIRGDRDFEGLFAHELAHMWFGDLVTLDSWGEIWLNEGFAVYMDLMYAEHKYGWDYMRRRQAVTDSVYYSRPDLDHPVGAPPVNRLFSFVVYNKGGRIVDMLRMVSRMRYMTGPPLPPESWDAAFAAGDERFRGILSDYLAEDAFGNVTTADLQAAAGARMGENLEWFFDQWLYRTGYPVLAFDWEPRTDGSGLTVRVRQTQAESYRVPIPVRYVSGDVVLDEVRELNGELTEWTVSLPTGEWSVELDAEDWVLEKHSRADLFPVLTNFGVQPNPSADRFYFSGELEGDIGAPVRLRVFDVQGRLVTDQDLGVQPPGPLTVYWSGQENTPRPAPSGVYVVELRVGEEAFRTRLVLVRETVGYTLD